MKQWMWTIEINTPPTREEFKRRKLLAWADKLYTILTAAACVLATVLAVIGLAYCLGGRPCTVRTVAPPVDGPAPMQMIAEDARLAPQETTEVTPLVDPAEEPEQARVWDTPLSETELAALLSACEAGHIDPLVGLGLIQTESGFNSDAVNPSSGCYGYCQLNPRYFPAGLSPEENIATGIGYLAQQLERYDDLEAALTAYNAGHDTGDRTYARLVMGATEEWTR